MTFNIGIESRLKVDPKSSATEINKVLRSSEFKGALESVKVKLEANLNQKEYSSFRASVNKILKEVSSDGGTSSVKVNLEVDKNKAVKSINSALTEAAKELKKIKVDIDARVDKKSLQEQLNPTPVNNETGTGAASARLSTEQKVTQEKREQVGAAKELGNENHKISQSNKKASDQYDALEASLKAMSLETINLKNQYASVEDLSKSINEQFKKGNHEFDTSKTRVLELSNGLEKVVLQVEKYNQELRKAQTFNITAKQNPAGHFEPTSIKEVDNQTKAMHESTRQAEKLARATIASYENIIASGSRVEDTYKKQIAVLKEKIRTQELDQQGMKRLVADQKIAIKADEQKAKAIDLQTKLLHQHTKAMQQNHRHIDKRAMKQLADDIRQVSLSSSNALPQLQAMQGRMQGYVNQAAQATRSQMGIIENFNNAMVKFPIWMGASTLFFGAIQSARTFIETIVTIDSKMITLQKVMSDSANMDEVFHNASVAAERFGQTLSDVLDAYAEFARQGYEGIDLANFGNAALITSNVGEIDAQKASEFLTASAAQWKTDSEAAMDNIDSWNELANNYATTVEKLGEGQAKAGATAKAMGMDFDETNAVIGALTAQTKQSGSEIGNFIKSAFPRMYAGAGRDVFEELGISMQTANGETKNAITLLREASHAMEGLNQQDQADAIRGLGGVWHYQRMQVLLDTLRDANGLYDQMLDSSRNAEGSAAAENAVYMESLEARINKAKVAIEEFSLALGEAFLESGILEFLTNFTQFMTQLTKAFTDVNPVIRNLAFGTLIGTLATMSKGVRNLYANLWDLPKAFGRVREAAERTAQAQNYYNRNPINLTTANPTAQGNSVTKSLADTRRLQEQSAQSAFLLSNANKEVAKTSNTASAATQGLSRTQRAASTVTAGQVMQTNLLSRASTAGTVAMRGLAAATRGLMAATGVGLVIGGITWALEKFINKSAEASSQANEFAQSQDVLRQSLESDGDRVNDLVSEYKSLEHQLQNGEFTIDGMGENAEGMAESSEKAQRYAQVTKELSMLFPDLVSGTDEYGKAIADQQGVIEARIAMVERQIEAEKELTEVQAEQKRKATIEAGKEAAERQAGGIMHDDGINATSRTADFMLNQNPEASTFLRQQIEDMKTLNDLAKTRNYVEGERQRLIEKDPEKYQASISQYSSMLDYLDERFVLHQQQQMEIQAGYDAQAQGFLDNVSAQIEQNSQLGQSTGDILGGVASKMGAMGDEIEDMSGAYARFQSALSFDSDFIDKMGQYETAVQSFYDATDDASRFESLQQIEVSFTEVAEAIRGVLQEAGLSSDAIDSIVGSLEAAELAALGFNTETFDTIQNQTDLENKMLETGDAIDQQTYSWQKATGAMTAFTDEMRALDGELGTIEEAIESLTSNGEIDNSKMWELLDIYPELAAAMGDNDEMLQMLMNRHGELTDAQSEAVYQQTLNAINANAAQEENEKQTNQAKLNSNADKNDAISSNEDDALAEDADRSETEADNNFKKEQSKEVTTKKRAKIEGSTEADLVDEKGGYYQTDYGNYGDLANEKEATEVGLINRLRSMWSSYITYVHGIYSSVYNKVKDLGKSIAGKLGFGEDEFIPADDFQAHIPNIDAGYETTRGIVQNALNIQEATRIHKEAMSELSKEDHDFIDQIQDRGNALRDLGDTGVGSGKKMEDFGRKAGSGAKAAKKGTKDLKEETEDLKEESEETKEKIKDLNVEVERQYKTFQKQTFVLNKYEESLRKINVQLEKQNLQTQKYATHSANYRRALREENKLNEKKLKVMQQQEASLKKQIDSGKINQYGMVSQDVNVGYNKYSTSSSGEGKTTAKTGTVTVAKSQNQVSPFAGLKTNYGYSPQGGGTYARQIGFNGGRHYGIDFGGKTGQTIKTPHGGKVVKAGWSPYGGGYQVEIYNKAMDKTFTFMHMLQDLAVKTGQTVQAGQKVGRMGSTGNSTGTHLHFQVNNGRGLSNAKSINPRNYLTSNEKSWIGAVASKAASTNVSTNTPNKLGQKISEDTASYLNAMEQAQLAAIEQSIENHNKGQQNKSDVQDARENLDKMMLERLQLMATMKENDYKIIESYIESYDVNQNALNHKITQLEYQADTAARKAGKTSDSAEWRKYMNRANNEREKQLKFQQQQINYIEKILANDARKSPANRMNEAHRFQLEEKLRDAKEQVVSLRRSIDEAESSILTSQANQIMSQLDDQLAAIDKKITLIQHKRQFFDTENDEGAKKAIKNIKEEIKQQDKREQHLTKAIKSLKGLRSHLRQQPELYQQVTDKIETMESALLEVESATHNLNKEIDSLQEAIMTRKVDRVFEKLNKNIEKAQKKLNLFKDDLHYINRDMQPDLYFGKQADILEEMQKQKDVIGDNIKELNKLEKEVKKFPELHKRVTDELKNWEEQQKSVRQEMHTLRSEFSSSFVESIKKIYQEQQNLAIEAIDKEYSEYEKMIQKKMKLIDDAAQEEQYNDDIAERQKTLQELRDEIGQRMGDDSLANQRRLKELQEELQEAEKEYNKFITNKERERRKEALQEELEDAKELADDKKENTNQIFEDLLNDQRKFNEIQENIMKGQIDKYKDIYKELTDFVNTNIKDIGKSVSEGMLDGITTSFEALEELSKLLTQISKDDVKVPVSGLRPIDPKTGDTINELIKGISNNVSLMNLGTSPSLPELNTGTSSVTNNNNTHNIESLVRIENFKGTQKEKDEFLNFLETELRKQGLI